MFPEKSLAWGQSKSCIRELAAYGAARKAQIGADKVFDFSIGSPSVPAPQIVNDTLVDLIQNTKSVVLHDYTPAVGLPGTRRAIAEDLNARYNAGISPDMVYMTCGAAAGLTAACRGLLCPGEEAITFAPFFPEYTVFVESAGANLVAVPPMGDMQPDMAAFENAITEKTKMVIMNTPNNPSGVILSAESIRNIAGILERAQEKYGHPIYLLSDEPYRELIFDGSKPLCVTHFYKNSIICYSFSKSLSLPGERIGYLAVSSQMEDKELVYAAICGGGRGCGYVNAPSLMQRLLERCVGLTSDISEYKENRDLLYDGLTALGFDCVKPDGAFYLFMKCPEESAKSFSDRAKKYELLLVPSDDFGVTGYVRLAYCVARETIVNSMPAFKKLAEEYGL